MGRAKARSIPFVSGIYRRDSKTGKDTDLGAVLKSFYAAIRAKRERHDYGRPRTDSDRALEARKHPDK